MSHLKQYARKITASLIMLGAFAGLPQDNRDGLDILTKVADMDFLINAMAGVLSADAHNLGAIGFSAGPERPPVPVLSFGCNSESSARPRIVFTSESPSAPAASTARATAGTSQLAGDSFA